MSSDLSVSSDDELPYGELLEWTRYFDELDDAMHDFEASLARQEVEPLRPVQAPWGKPPEILHTRWSQAYQRISELEFRARSMREELRTEFARLSGGRRVVQTRPSSGYGSALDISG